MFSDQKKLSGNGYKEGTEVLELEEDKGNKHFLDRKCLIKLSNLPSKTYQFSLSFCLFCYENKQNLRGNIFPKQVKLKTTGQREKQFCKKIFSIFASNQKWKFNTFYKYGNFGWKFKLLKKKKNFSWTAIKSTLNP